MSDSQSHSDDLMRRIARVGADIDPGLSDRDVERLVEGARLRRRRRTVARVAVGTVAAGVAAIAAVVVMHGWQTPSVDVAGGVAAPGRVMAAAPRQLRLADGSVATPLDQASALVIREDAPKRVAIDVARGRGHFDVAPRPERLFAVHAGDVTITVIGTAFTVERVADRIGVSVERGKVQVDWGVGSRRLGPGESGWFPPLATVAVGAAAASATLPPSSASPTAIAPVVRARHKSVKVDGDDVAKPVVVVDTAESLLAAADAARLQGRAQEGAALLRRIVNNHRSDPRAPLAAFTLGRVLLMELGQPRQAASAFADARALAPDGPFAEDALARETEAWAKAGDRTKARACAQDYLRSYPSGLRAPAVRALGGGE
jgi:transmembrane sensor